MSALAWLGIFAVKAVAFMLAIVMAVVVLAILGVHWWSMALVSAGAVAWYEMATGRGIGE